MVAEQGGELYALLVDQVSEVMSLDPSTFERNPPTLPAEWAQFSSGIYRLEGRLLVVLDVSRLLALAEEKSGGAQQILRQAGVTREAIMSALRDVRGSQRVTDQNAEDRYQSLEKYGRDLTVAARKGKTDPVIGRDAEIRRLSTAARDGRLTSAVNGRPVA